MATNDYKSYLSKLENLLEEYLVKKAPALPTGVKEAIVRFAPWITIILMVLALPLVLAFLGLGAVLAPFSFLGGLSSGVNYFANVGLTIVMVVLEAIAIPGLFKKTRKAWTLVYYSMLVGALQSIVSFNLGGLIIGSGLFLYLLFQVREYYK